MVQRKLDELLYWLMYLNIVKLSVTTHKKKLKSVSTERLTHKIRNKGNKGYTIANRKRV